MLLVACITSACSDSATDLAVTSPTIAPNQTSSSPSTNARADFHARNHLDWVGRAHNKALDDFAAMVKAKGASKDLCAAVIAFMSAPERMPGNGNKGDATSRKSAAVAGVRASGICNSQFATNSAHAWLAAAVENDSFSYAANRLFDRIESAQLAAITSAELAAYLSPILSEADAFGEGVDRDGVYAVASVAQSSFEYWEVEAMPLVETVDAEYGTCLGQYDDQAYALDTCMGITYESAYSTGSSRGFDSAPRMFLAQGDVVSGEQHMSRPRIVGSDIGGAIAGAFIGTFFTPGLGTLMGAINGAGSASTSVSWGSAAAVVYCRKTEQPRKTALTEEA